MSKKTNNAKEKIRNIINVLMADVHTHNQGNKVTLHGYRDQFG